MLDSVVTLRAKSLAAIFTEIGIGLNEGMTSGASELSHDGSYRAFDL
jgi:hypothetical protein